VKKVPIQMDELLKILMEGYHANDCLTASLALLEFQDKQGRKCQLHLLVTCDKDEMVDPFIAPLTGYSRCVH